MHGSPESILQIPGFGMSRGRLAFRCSTSNGLSLATDYEGRVLASMDH